MSQDGDQAAPMTNPGSSTSTSDVRITLPKIRDKASWPAARFQVRNWLRMHDLLALVDNPAATMDTKVNGKIFGVIAAQCEGSALTIAQGVPEGDGRALFRHFDVLWRSDKPASLIDCVKKITTSTLTESSKFEIFVAERAAAAQRLRDGGMPLPDSFVALCLLLGLSSCSQLSGLLSIYAMEEANATTVTTARVTEAARNMLHVGTSGGAGDDLRDARKQQQVLAAEVKTLKRELMDFRGSSGTTTTTNDTKPQDGCFYCKKGGHRAFNCRKLKSDFPKMSKEQQSKWERYAPVRVNLVEPTSDRTDKPNENENNKQRPGRARVTDLL